MIAASKGEFLTEMLRASIPCSVAVAFVIFLLFLPRLYRCETRTFKSSMCELRNVRMK